MNFKNILLAITFLIAAVGCKKEIKEKTKEVEKKQIIFANKGHEFVYNFVNKVGDYKKLRLKKDVVYTYSYATPDTKSDVSIEKYIFEGELSYGEYEKHERTLPELNGTMQQGYDGKEYWLKVAGESIDDEAAIKRVKFNRPTNYYWFTMFQKLLDPGLVYDYLGSKELMNKSYDIVKVSFNKEEDIPSDIYQLYINKETGLVDQFLFTVVDFGVVEKPFLMQMEYETIDDLLIPTKRQYKKSNWEAEVFDTPWIYVNWTNIKFDNNLNKEDFFK